jgi:phage baseplate assembly protein V
MRQAIEKLIAPLATRVYSMIARGVLAKAASEKNGRSTVQVNVLAGETLDGIENLQHYGFASRPKKGAEVVLVFFAGGRDHGHVVASQDAESRPELKEGEVALFTDQDVLVKLDEDEKVSIEGKNVTIKVKSSGKVSIDGKVKIDGDVEIEGKLKLTGDLQASGTTHTLNGLAVVINGLEEVTVDGLAVNVNALGGTYIAHSHTLVTTGYSTSGPVAPV